MSSPAFQFYPRDWTMSTRTMSPAARGVYIDLLAYGWELDGLPNDEKTLAGLVMLTPAKFKRIWPEIADKWIEAEEGKLRNPRQERQRAELIKLRKKRAAAGRASAAARKDGGDK